MCIIRMIELFRSIVYAFVFTLTLTIVSSMLLPSNGCSYNEFYSDTLESCVPCDDICYEGSWSDCERNCKAYFLTLKRCPCYQFWSETLEICLNCSLVCMPITSKDCFTRCNRFIEHQTTSTTPLSSIVTTSLRPAIKSHRFESIELILLISIPCSVVFIFTLALLAVRYYKNRVGKTPIQETAPLQPGSVVPNATRHGDIETAGLRLILQNVPADEQESAV